MMALSERDIKRIVAYASISHLGFIALGVFSLTENGVNGAIRVYSTPGKGTWFLILFPAKNRRPLPSSREPVASMRRSTARTSSAVTAIPSRRTRSSSSGGADATDGRAVGQMRALTDEGMERFMLQLFDQEDIDALRLVGESVVPAVGPATRK